MSTERELAEKFKEAIGTRDVNAIYPYLAEGMTYEVLPSTISGKKTSRDEWKVQMTGLLDTVQFADLELTNVVERPLFVAVQANVILTFPLGPFTQEVLLLFNFSKDEGGALKIVSVIEYVDSFRVKEFKNKMASIPPHQ